MHHPTDRTAHSTAFVTPVVEHWLDENSVVTAYGSDLTDSTFTLMHHTFEGVRCSAVLRVFAHGAMGRRIDPSLTH